MTCITSADFYASWKQSVSADFQQDGVPAGSEPWVTEATKITVNGETRVAVLSDNASMLAAGVGDETHVYDTATGRLLHTLRGHAGYTVENLEFQPGGRRLAAGSTRIASQRRESLVRVWDLDAPAQSLDYVDDAAKHAVIAASSILLQNWSAEDLESADLQPQIAQILAAAQAAVDVRNGRVVLGHLPSFEARSFSHDGRSLLYLPDRKTVSVVDPATLKERFRLFGHTDAIMWAETSPDDKVVATSSWDKTVRIWSMGTGEAIRVLAGATGQSWAGAFSPDGEFIAAGAGDQMVRIWRVDTGELLHTLSGFTDWIRSLAFSLDGLQLAAGAAGGTLRVFDLKSGECAQSWQIDVETDRSARSFLEVHGVRYTSRGDLFFCSTEGRIFGYRASQNLKWEFFQPDSRGSSSRSIAISADGSKLIAALGSNIGTWNID